MKQSTVLNVEDVLPADHQFNEPGDPEFQNPSSDELGLYFSAIWLLRENLDLVDWAACQTEAWSPEITGLGLSAGLRREIANPKVAFVTLLEREGARGRTDKATGALVVPLQHPDIQSSVKLFRDGGDYAFCAVMLVAGTILHEATHTVGDEFGKGLQWKGYGANSPWATTDPAFGFPGTEHDDNAHIAGTKDDVGDVTQWGRYTCWDEARMVASMWQWAMAHRYPCPPQIPRQQAPGAIALNDDDKENLVRCQRFGADSSFANSAKT